jgi:CheY-like chemotaxis protein
MRTLVIDMDPEYAATLGRILKSQGCQVHIVSTTREAVASLQGQRFDVILMDIRGLSSSVLVILQELYNNVSRHTNSPRICLMSNSPSSSLLSEVRSNGALESIPANAESILRIVRSTDDSNVVLVAGDAASTEMKRTLLQEGYPAVVVRSLDDAIRQLFDGTYPVVFLETGATALAYSGEFLILRRLTAEPLACLASTQTDSYLRHVVKPHKVVEITELLSDLQKDIGDAELRMAAGRA